MDNTVETEVYKGYTINIAYDMDPESPREWDNITVMHCCHTEYNLGDEQYNLRREADKEDWVAMLKQVKRNGDIVLPLYIFDHSGITVSLTPFSCRWDSGQVGYVIVPRKKMIEEFNKKNFTPALKKKALEIAENEVKTYDMFLRGDVYGYEIEDSEGESIDSCWGYFGSDYTDLLNEAQSVIDNHIERERKEHQKKLKAQIKGKTPLEKREILST